MDRRDQPEVFERIFDQVPVGMLLACPGSRWMRANQAFCALVGRDEAEVLALGLEGLSHPEDREAATEQLARAQRSPGREVAFEQRYLRPDGAVVWVRASVFVSPGEDGAEALTAIKVDDITDRKRADAQRALTERMATMGTLAAGVAHEINNPLAYVLANLDLSLEQVGALPDAPADLAESLREAREGAKRIQGIVRDLRMFSRPDDERRGPVDVRRVLESCINVAWNEIRHRARLVKDYGAGVPPAEGSEARLGQVFLNLLVNAAQALPEGAADRHEIRVLTRRWSDGRVAVEVRDTGPGIAPEIREKIFEPFVSSKPAAVGTGLGLAICQGIVHALGGEIQVESAPETGTVFRVLLAASRSGQTGPHAVDNGGSVAATCRRGRVLVLDDEPFVVATVRRALGSRHEVLAPEDARGALALLRAGERFDVVLCDLMMPVMSGMAFYEELSRTAPECAARVIFLTGGAFSPQARAFLDHVPNVRLEKPFEIQSLRALVERFVR